jgi:hypothetical protein
MAQLAAASTCRTTASYYCDFHSLKLSSPASSAKAAQQQHTHRRSPPGEDLHGSADKQQLKHQVWIKGEMLSGSWYGAAE